MEATHNANIEIRDQRQKEWLWIDNDFVDHYMKIVGPIATQVYLSLSRHAHNATQSCFPSMSKIAEELGLKNRNTISRAIKKLEEYALIEIKESFDTANNRRRNNVYILRNKKDWIMQKGNVRFRIVDLEEIDLKENDLFEVTVEKIAKKKAEEIDRAVFPWLNYDAWQAWVKYRIELKKPLKPSTIALQIKLLEKNKDDHVAILEKSIERGWLGLFPLEKDPKKQKVESGKYAKYGTH